MVNCIHREEQRLCPISKIPCPGECIYGDVLENISVGILVFDTKGERVIFQNRTAADIFKDIKPKDYKSLNSTLPELRECLTSKSPPFPQAKMYGTKLLGYTIYNIVEGYSWVFVLDITERRQVEKERALLTAAVELADGAIVITNTDGVISYANPALERVTGYQKEEVLGQHIRILVRSSDDDKQYFTKIFAQLRKGEVWCERMASRKKDGSTYVSDITISPVRNPSGEIMNYVVFQTDVTEKVRLESIAEAINTMNNTGYIFSGLRHEIGNPINSIKVTLGVLRANLDKYSSETVKIYVDRAMNEIARVEYLLNAMKSFNMYENPKTENVDIVTFMDKFLTLVREDFEQRGVGIQVIIHPEVKYMHADPRALQQVMLNILSNASDAFQERQDAKVIINIYKMHNNIRISVIDNGCGISEGELDHIFKPFFTTKVSGTGLGLVLTKKMLAKMNSTIEVTSIKNAGTIVEIDIPGVEK